MYIKDHFQLVTCCLIIVHVDSLKLQIAISMIRACWVYSMLVTDNLPKLQKYVGMVSGMWAGKRYS
jgi:hypothetical protein